MASEVYYLIKDLGFPIVMVLYFMTINNKTISKNTDAINNLSTLIKIKVK